MPINLYITVFYIFYIALLKRYNDTKHIKYYSTVKEKSIQSISSIIHIINTQDESSMKYKLNQFELITAT